MYHKHTFNKKEGINKIQWYCDSQTLLFVKEQILQNFVSITGLHIGCWTGLWSFSSESWNELSLWMTDCKEKYSYKNKWIRCLHTTPEEQ